MECIGISGATGGIGAEGQEWIKNDWKEPKQKEKYLLSEIPGTNNTWACRLHYFPCDDVSASSGIFESRNSRKINDSKGRLKKSTYEKDSGRRNGLRMKIRVTNVSVDDAAYEFDEGDVGVASQLWVQTECAREISLFVVTVTNSQAL